MEAFERFFDSERPPFAESPYGAGAFGRWITDARGDPAYEYEMDQGRDVRAACRTSSGASHDHWHLIGNDRISATAHNGGYVQVYDWTRGGKILDRWDPARAHFAGGFKFVAVDGAAFNTLYERLPQDSTQRRIFGMGYFEKITQLGDLVFAERIEAPQGDDPVLLSSTRIENHRERPLEISLVEFWDVNLHQLTAAPVMTYRLSALYQWRRRQLNRRFTVKTAWREDIGALSVTFAAKNGARAPRPEAPARMDYHPKTMFLAALDALPSGFRGYATDAGSFFDARGLDAPPGVRGAADGRLLARQSAYPGKAILALRRNVRLAPGETIAYRYLYGYSDAGAIPDLVQRYRQPLPEKRMPVLEWAAPECPWLGRELAWHSYYLQAGTYYNEFFNAHFVDQGSAYSYLQGMSGATRDFALFTLPLIYLRPDLAKEMLRFLLRSQDANTGAFPYAHVGHGKCTGFVVHSKSSDLDLFVFCALAEYLGATRDIGFLDEDAAFYPPAAGRSGTVLDHVRASFGHLEHRVGLGPHGVLRCGTGDWNDALMAFSRCYPLTLLRGESAFNAGLAAFALPLLAGAIESKDANLARRLRDFGDGQARALKPLWMGDWVARGYLGYANSVLGRARLFLDTQAFGVLGGVWDRGQIARLFARIEAHCVEPEPAGARCMWPPMKGPFLDPGSDTNGGTWAAIDAWTAWAWLAVDPARAWPFFLRTTLAAHAEAYPHIWYGVWSGPDSFNAAHHRYPGETFDVTVTPMIDYPVMNMNRHMGPLLAAIKFAGIQPRDGTLIIDPRVPLDAFAIRLPLIGAAYLPDRHRGYYTPVAAGDFRFAIRPPRNLQPETAALFVNGNVTPFAADSAGLFCFEVSGMPGKKITWELR